MRRFPHKEMADVIVGMRMNVMDVYEEKGIGIVPLIGTPTAMCSNEMINDCFFGSDYAPSPLFRRRTSNESVTCGEDNALTSPSDQPNLAVGAEPFADQFFGVEGESPPTRKFCEDDVNVPVKNSWRAEESSSSCLVDGLSWIEEWMDMNGIFDPTNDLISFDIDLPECHQSILHDQVIPEVKIASTDASALPTARDDQIVVQQRSCSASGCNEMQQEASLEWSVEAEYSPVLEAISAEGEKPAIEKSVGKSFVLRPVPEATARLISPLPPGEHRLRSARSRNSTTAIGVLGRATSAVTDRTQREVNHKMSRKFPTSPFISEKKREQNRSAAIRYRDRRREEAKRKKEELHELELRNVALKTQVSGLSKEIGYLRGILNEMLSC
uniref:BZIP domain-containing protein n=1 Tax=Parascaris univalens TaxID=6257 RepID=A0A915AER1_PARUN